MLALLRVHLAARTRAVNAGVRALEPTLYGWLVGGADVHRIVELLRRQTPYVAFRSLAHLALPVLQGGNKRLRCCWIADVS